jgi:hypothetical protein
MGCEKGTGEFLIKGTVTDETFNQGLQGATASIYKVPIGTSDELFVESVLLSSNGNYEFVVPREKMERYILRVNKDLYFPIEEDIYYSSLSIKDPIFSIYRQTRCLGLKYTSKITIPLLPIILGTSSRKV